MSLRAFAGGEADEGLFSRRRQRNDRTGRLEAVLGAGIRNHQSELNARLGVQKAPQGPSGLKGLPLSSSIALPPPPHATPDSTSAVPKGMSMLRGGRQRYEKGYEQFKEREDDKRGNRWLFIVGGVICCLITIACVVFAILFATGSFNG